MIEFIENCFSWFSENYQKIIMTITSAQFVSLISAIVLLIKNGRELRNNVASSKSLNKTLSATNQMSDDVTSVKNKLEEAEKENKLLKNELEKLNTLFADGQESLIKKLNCMLEVQSIVYSTIKNDSIRDTVNCILTNAKYTETATRAKLKEEVASLKERLNAETEKVNKIAEDATNTITKIVEPDANDNSAYVRY